MMQRLTEKVFRDFTARSTELQRSACGSRKQSRSCNHAMARDTVLGLQSGSTTTAAATPNDLYQSTRNPAMDLDMDLTTSHFYAQSSAGPSDAAMRASAHLGMPAADLGTMGGAAPMPPPPILDAPAGDAGGGDGGYQPTTSFVMPRTSAQRLASDRRLTAPCYPLLDRYSTTRPQQRRPRNPARRAREPPQGAVCQGAHTAVGA